MNASELAQALLLWEKLMNQAKLVEMDIQKAVLVLGKTQTVGNVRASYSGGRKTYDYQTPALDAPVELIADYTKTETVVTTDWKMICELAGKEPLVVSQTAPSVTVKMVG